MAAADTGADAALGRWGSGCKRRAGGKLREDLLSALALTARKNTVQKSPVQPRTPHLQPGQGVRVSSVRQGDTSGGGGPRPTTRRKHRGPQDSLPLEAGQPRDTGGAVRAVAPVRTVPSTLTGHSGPVRWLPWLQAEF